MRLIAVVALVAFATSTVAHATPAQDLDRGRTSFKSKDYSSAIPVLNTLLYPEPGQLTRQEEIIEALLMLGASLYETGNRDRAIREFEKALQLEPDRSITPMFYTEGAIRLFEETKRDVLARIERDAERKRLAEVRAKLEEYRKSLIVYEARPYYVNFVPFGAGQFQNRQRTKGILFAAGQGLTGGVSAGIFIYLSRKYGLSFTQPSTVPLDEAPTALLLQRIEIGAGIAFLALYGYGIIDALLNHQPRVQVKGDDTLLPADMKDLSSERSRRRPPKQTSMRDRLRFGPVVLPSGFGIGLSLESH